MKLVEARITNFKSIDDSECIRFDDVTCLVGKNESGKTAILQALHKISPVGGINGNFNILDYPRKGYTKYRAIHEEQPAVAVQVGFELSQEEITAIEMDLGDGVIKSNVAYASKNFKNVRQWVINVEETATIKHFLASAALPPDISNATSMSSTCKEALEILESYKDDNPDIEIAISDLRKRCNPTLAGYIASEYLDKYVPQFLYFDEYSVMPGTVSVQYLKQRRDNNQLDCSDQTIIALLSITGSTLEDFENQANYESSKAELEAASIGITDEVFAFWSQNTQLEVEFDVSQANADDAAPLNSGTILHIRIKNNRHRVTVPFDQRSRGFVWFFSFLAYFSQFENSKSDLILLLDEPGLSLHAKAQADFLRFINERLAPNHQVIYSTHSPFMVDPNQLQKVRTVQDIDNRGTVVSSDILNNDHDTVYPLQAALGYDLAQTLFVGPHCLLVEGPSDLIYLQILSEVCTCNGLESLDKRWVIVPVGGADKVSTFVSLLGANKLDIAVLMDVSSKDMQRIKKLQGNGFLGVNNLIDVGSIIGAKDADIEDLFNLEFYLKLLNGAYASELPGGLSESDIINANPRVVKRISAYFKENNVAGGYFSHYLPSVYLLHNQKELLVGLDRKSIEFAASLFSKINMLLLL